MNAAPVRSRAQRMAAGWFLGVVVVAFVVFAWLRGAGRMLVPLVVVGAVAWIVLRLLRVLRAPVD